MDDMLRKSFPNEDADSSFDISTSDINQDNSISYQTADEGNSRYFSVIENDSTLEGINDISLQVESEQDTLTESQHLMDSSSLINTSSKSGNMMNSLSNISMEAVNKFNLHDKIESGNILSGGVDIFDDNESSVDGHELVIDDDPQPSEKSDDCPESGTEASTDMQYKYDDNATENDMQKNFSMLKNNDAEDSEIVNDSQEVNGVESEGSQLESFKILENSEEIYGNFPEGSHAVNLLIDGNNVEAINIGKDVYICTGSNGGMTAFQVLKEGGDCTIKYLQVEKNEDGNLVVYEEQVKEISDCNEEIDSTKDKDSSVIEKEIASEEITKQQNVTDPEKNSIKAITDQEKKLQIQNEKDLVENIDTNVVQLKNDKIPCDDDKLLSEKATIEVKKSSVGELILEKIDTEKSSDANECLLKENNLDSETIVQKNTENVESIIESGSDDCNDEKLVIDAPEPEILDECSSKNPEISVTSAKVVDAENAEKIVANSKHINTNENPSFFSTPIKSNMEIVENKEMEMSNNGVVVLLQLTEESNIADVKKDDLDNKINEPENVIIPDSNVNFAKLTDTKICDNTHLSLESDDEFGDEFIGEPVTGDSEINWMDSKQNDVTSVPVEKINVPILDDKLETMKSKNEILYVRESTETELKNISVDSDLGLNGNLSLKSKICDLPEELSLIDAQILVSSDEMKENQNDLTSDKITLHSFEDTVVKSVNIKVKLQNDNESNIFDNPIFSDSDIGNKIESDIISANIRRNLNSNIKSYIGKKSKMASPRSKPMISPKEPVSRLEIVNSAIIDVKSPVKNLVGNVDSTNVVYDIFKVPDEANISLTKETSENHIVILQEEKNNEEIISPLKSLERVISEDLSSNEQSPRSKSRQPRKQIFTPVPSSDIEMIFSNTKKDVNLISPRGMKSHSRSKSRIDFVSNINKKKNSEPIEPLIVQKSSEPKVDENVDKTELSETVNNTSTENIDYKNPSKGIDTDNDNDNSFKSADNDSQNIDINEAEVSKSVTDNDTSFKSINTDNETPSKNTDISANLSNSAKRKRGRPKKLISSESNTFESLILNVDGSVITPTKENSEKKSPAVMDSKELQHSPDKKAVIESKDDMDLGEESETNSPTQSGKRKKGRPKKLIEITESSTNSSIKSDVNMNESVKLLFDDNLSENICPICSKNFRSRNVLLKHAKHCNGVITAEFVKSPKRRKINAVDENTSIDSIANETDDKIPSDDDDDKAKDEVLDQKDDITDTSLSQSAILIEDSICEKTDVEIDKIECQESSKISDVSPSENDKSENVSEDVNKTELAEESSDKITELPLKLVKKREPRNVPPSPMSRLSKILNTKSTANKIIKCEICGKVFRQLAHMVVHRKKHENEKRTSRATESGSNTNTNKSEDNVAKQPDSDSILKCDICKKGFRKLHHLVEHREVHINAEVKSRRASVASAKSETEAGFRCDTCDKSFRKLHHLVEHRELHAAELNESKEKIEPKANATPGDGDATCNGCGKSFRKRYHMLEHRDIHCSPSKIRNLGESTTRSNTVRLSINSSTSEDSNNCDICGKSYRKLHHMIEHREVHAESNSKQTEDSKISSRIPVPDVLNTKDIIHECSRCYMVFPNINSLNKHMVKCLNRRKLLRKSTITEGAANRQAENKASIRKSIDKPIVKKELRKSTDSKSSERKREITKPPISLPKAAKTIPAKQQPSEIKIKKPEKSIVEESKVKNKNTDDHFKYKINPAFKSNTRLSLNTAAKLSPKTTANTNLRKSVASHIPLKKTDKLLETIVEESSFRYSFPKTPKQNAKEEESAPSSNSKKTKDKNEVAVTTRATTLVANTSKRKSLTGDEPRLVVKRKSIGGRKSLDRKSLDAKTLPKTKSKLQLRCCKQVFESQALLAIHRKTHSETRKSHKCDCGKQFSNDVLLKRHMDTEHTPPKSFKCQDCGVSVRTAAQFAKHKTSHEDAGAFVHPGTSKPKNSPRNIMKTIDKSANQTKNANKDKAVTSTPSSNVRKRRSAHGGVPLSDKMRKALAGALCEKLCK